jgi:hypothetical protein
MASRDCCGKLNTSIKRERRNQVPERWVRDLPIT